MMLSGDNAPPTPRTLTLTPRQGGAPQPSPQPTPYLHTTTLPTPPARPAAAAHSPRTFPTTGSARRAPENPPQPSAFTRPTQPGRDRHDTAAPATTTDQSPNGVKTPQQIYDQLMKLQIVSSPKPPASRQHALCLSFPKGICGCTFIFIPGNLRPQWLFVCHSRSRIRCPQHHRKAIRDKVTLASQLDPLTRPHRLPRAAPPPASHESGTPGTSPGKSRTPPAPHTPAKQQHGANQQYRQNHGTTPKTPGCLWRPGEKQLSQTRPLCLLKIAPMLTRRHTFPCCFASVR